MMKVIAIVFVTAIALSPGVVSAACPYDSNCLDNQYGAGSPYKSDGLMNPYSQYGSKHSNKSWTNPYDPDSTSNPYGRYGSKYSPDSINNPYGAGNPYSNNPTYVVPSK